jgi:hypothetical protein
MQRICSWNSDSAEMQRIWSLKIVIFLVMSTVAVYKCLTEAGNQFLKGPYGYNSEKRFCIWGVILKCTSNERRKLLKASWAYKNRFINAPPKLRGTVIHKRTTREVKSFCLKATLK